MRDELGEHAGPTTWGTAGLQDSSIHLQKSSSHGRVAPPITEATETSDVKLLFLKWAKPTISFKKENCKAMKIRVWELTKRPLQNM
jgi:hypothetical protein